MTVANLKSAVMALNQGQVIAYPTEAVYGLGCDPDNVSAVNSILALKQRCPNKGLILIAADYAQLKPYIDETQLNVDQLRQIHQTWPGPVTWVMPRSQQCPDVICGGFDSVAVRVSAHPLVQNLCRAFNKPIVSTSANPAGEASALTAVDVVSMFGNEFGVVLDGPTGGESRPSSIFNALNGQQLR